ncbi:hypothetical protein SAMN05216353_103173 [Halobacillus alkaliphilus]|uniref:Sigma-X negative effector n=1 Tax=Halobacillus alkaliphilus TaxID=396056 RepID=A0A1I2KBV1_9BACI|nr:hypothetical protein [Halobacillus alkaliphilus]SFF62406.1 hypothetical protein SAMN05216353_103173 [Halobacillus alkaliphilus]
MKRKSYSEDELKEMLGKFPKMEDKKSKEDLYRSIEPELNKRKRRIAPWITPSMATAAVLLILAIVLPVFLSSLPSNEYSGSADQQESSTESANEPGQDQAETTEQKPSEIEDSSRGENNNSTFDKSETEVNEGTESPFTIQDRSPNMESYVLPGENGEVVVPFTVIKRDDQEGQKVASLVKPENWGLAEDLIKELTFKIDEEREQADVIFPDNFSINGSAYTSIISESIRWRLHPYDVKTINLQTESGSPVVLGNFGEVNTLPIIEENRYFYQIYTSEVSERQFLVPIKAEKEISMEDALNRMKEEQTYGNVDPAVPGHVNFPSVSAERSTLTVTVEHDSWSSDQQLMRMIDAVLATAGNFGFKEVRFQNIKPEKSSSYKFSEPIPVPTYLNPINMNE